MGIWSQSRRATLAKQPARNVADSAPQADGLATPPPTPSTWSSDLEAPLLEFAHLTRDGRGGTGAWRLSPPSHWSIRYVVSVFCTLAATVLTLTLWQSVFSRNPFALFYAAVMLSAWYGGLKPGLVATACSVWAIDTFLLPSFVTAVPGWQEIVQVGIFGGVALLISSLNATRKRALRERDGMIALQHAARSEAESARRRSAMLADASNMLGASLSSPAAVGAVAERVVPEFGDWCVVDVVMDGGGNGNGGTHFRRLAIANADRDRRDPLLHLMRDYTLSENAGGVARVIRTGEAELVANVSAESLADLASREESMASFVAFGATSYLIAPLQTRGRTLGAVSLVSSNPDRAYGPHHLRLAEDLAHRLAVALDNARLYREAQDANRMKEEFLAVVSHELRTPLNAILGWAQLMHVGGLDEPSMAQGMSAIERNARAQARIIDDVLDVSRIIQGKLRLDLRPTSLRRVIRDALEGVRPAAATKRVALEVRLGASRDAIVERDPDIDLSVLVVDDECFDDRVNGDGERLKQVVLNLLTNAIKFTPAGGRVDVSLARDASGAGVELRVRDSGQGIDPRFLPHVFERFRQADSSTTRSHGGLGLGLAIVRHLVELHGGNVRAESDGLGKGATFTVRLPLEGRPDRKLAGSGDDGHVAVLPNSAYPELSGLRVLLVEDEPDARELFVNVLEHCGAVVTAVASAREGIEQFGTTRPDVILSDIGMAGEDGYALIRAVRSIESSTGSAPTPAMAITAFARPEDRGRALREGFQVHVPKPIGSVDFTAAVAELARGVSAPAAPTGQS